VRELDAESASPPDGHNEYGVPEPELSLDHLTTEDISEQCREGLPELRSNEEVYSCPKVREVRHCMWRFHGSVHL
jgi:hypothetical protein